MLTKKGLYKIRRGVGDDDLEAKNFVDFNGDRICGENWYRRGEGSSVRIRS